MTEHTIQLFQKIKAAQQGHLLRFVEILNPEQKDKFIQQLSTINFQQVNELAQKYILSPEKKQLDYHLAPVDVIPIPQADVQKQAAKSAKVIGEKMLRDGKVAALLVAGGQGSRLGFVGPKGKYKTGPVSDKTLFELHADKLKALEKRYGQPILWMIMTSESNHDETVDYFETHNYLGLSKEHVFFFKQGMIPALNEDGKILMDAIDHVFTNPNGHGGTLFALRDSGLLDLLKKRGIEEIFYFQVDNVLIRICDPYFIGYHVQAHAEMSAKIVRKRDPFEKVGIIGMLNGKVAVIEYSDMPEDVLMEKNPDGSLTYDAGSVAIHMFQRKFLERLTSSDLGLPYHVAHKKIPHVDSNGKRIEPTSPNGYKLEMFVFDAFPLSNGTIIMEVERSDEFSPIKNKSGEDSLAPAQQDLMNYHARMLQQAGIHVPFDSEGNVAGTVEISPLFAMDADELRQKLPPGFNFKSPLYLE
ncbi:UDPGP type 1 family protein [candidate division KSB1 bacterium]|nr:UDPGP type 1 family protein [candidate division KSB1 bacterium]